MKTLLALIFASALLFVLAPHAIGLEASASNVGSLQAGTCLTTDGSALPSFMLPIEVSWGLPGLPSCFDIEGNYCPSPGAPGVRCMWQGGEPGICFCQNNHTMLCG